MEDLVKLITNKIIKVASQYPEIVSVDDDYLWFNWRDIDFKDSEVYVEVVQGYSFEVVSERWAKVENLELFTDNACDFYHDVFSLRTYSKLEVSLKLKMSNGNSKFMVVPTVLVPLLYLAYLNENEWSWINLNNYVKEELPFYADALGALGKARIKEKTEDYYRAMKLLSPYRPRGKFYAFLSTVLSFYNISDIEEVIFLSDVIKNHEVWTADMRIADNVALGKARPEAYAKTLTRIDDVNNYPLYLSTTYDRGAYLLGFEIEKVIRTNEFIVQ